ncbi:hypothetical protein [Flavobacterium daejeonense]|uniref:hypothetical protein n=1 Tax=Flavobacterium daejeonense TaxID=350893 RepID=UPI000A9BC4EE|nr:hypothetical protein [Flavobacterium daejeonense]
MKPIKENILDEIYLPVFMCLAFALGLLHEFRNKVVEITIVKNKIEKKNFF